MEPPHSPKKLFKAYEKEENNNIRSLVVWEIIQWLGESKAKAFTQSKLISGREYLHIGCGDQLLPGFINLDCHTRKSLLSLGSDKIYRKDLRNGLPFSSNSFKGIFTEHCLEHLNPRESFTILEEIYRTLKPGGVARIIVPDAQKYVNYYNDKILKLPTDSYGNFNGWELGGEALRGLTCYLGHYTLYDAEMLLNYSKYIGFARAVKSCFGDGVAKELIHDSPGREWNSVYIDVIK